jgi:flagellar basal body-associated protein FliL
MRASKQNNRFRNGSALILVVVVTTLLAVVGVMFVMVTRVRDAASSNVADSRNLDNAVQSVVARINKTLTEDLLGTSATGQLLGETQRQRGV